MVANSTYIDDLDIDKGDYAKSMPAARCRECGVITWRVTIATGLRRCRVAHKRGCSKPPGRLDLLHRIPLARRNIVLAGRLLRPMSNAAVRAAAEELMWT